LFAFSSLHCFDAVVWETGRASRLKCASQIPKILFWETYPGLKTRPITYIPEVVVAVMFVQAYNYHGETLLAQDKCGDAIKCLEESQSRNSAEFLSFFYFLSVQVIQVWILEPVQIWR